MKEKKEEKGEQRGRGKGEGQGRMQRRQGEGRRRNQWQCGALSLTLDMWEASGYGFLINVIFTGGHYSVSTSYNSEFWNITTPTETQWV